MRFLLLASLLLTLAAPLAACGKKPSELEAPAQPDFTAPTAGKNAPATKSNGKPRDIYPQTYPKPWL